eukprot:2008000-Rhodomonas_salina.2
MFVSVHRVAAAARGDRDAGRSRFCYGIAGGRERKRRERERRVDLERENFATPVRLSDTIKTPHVQTVRLH